MRQILNMDREWRFHLGEIEQVSVNTHTNSYMSSKAGECGGAASPSFGDGDWRLLDVPHDYFAESAFSPENLHSHGYRDRGNAWYRKNFLLDPSLEGKQLLLCFEGTAVFAEFYFNGSLMARTFSAYSETVFDISDRAYFDGRPNTLAVHLDGLATEGWWYEGAGIYRHVRLLVKEPVHVAHNGLYVRPVLRSGTHNSWDVEVETVLENSGYVPETVCVKARILDGETSLAASDALNVTVAPNSAQTVRQKLKVSRPHRWDVDDPYLYKTEVSVSDGAALIDAESCRIGFRTIAYTAEEGFFLNGRNLKIKGTCNHQDHAGVGVAVPDRVQYWRIKRLKDMGTNAYRCSHNLPSRQILDACDELGMIVMDENRRFETRKEVLEAVEQMVRRDRNHPCVVFWSLFNEEPLQNTAEGEKIYSRMRSIVDKLDDTRFLTGAINGNMEGAGMKMDVTGINYNIKAIEAMHALHPDQPIIGSENNSAVTTRGCYRSDREEALVLSNYDEETVPWGQTIRETWAFVRKHPWFGGIFIWTGFDYRGEPTPFQWPCVSSQFGIMDTCGFDKDAFWYNKACFTDKPVVHLLPHWNWKKGENVRVVAVTNCEEVELFLNGTSLGRQQSDELHPGEWQVPFAPGRIEAKAYRNGRTVAKDVQRTAGKAVRLVMESVSDTVYNDGSDVLILNVHAVDKKGLPVPTANMQVHFKVEGDALFLGAGNGDPQSHEADHLPERRLFCGRCQLLVRALTGARSLQVTAEAEGLESASFSPDILMSDSDPVIQSTVNRNLHSITMSPVTGSRPDPLVKLEDNDMNSFMPVRIDGWRGQSDFTGGWRIYRAFGDVPGIPGEARSCVLEMENLIRDAVEIYVNGIRIHTEANSGRTRQTLRVPFTAVAGEKQEFRILIQLQPGKMSGGLGRTPKIDTETV